MRKNNTSPSESSLNAVSYAPSELEVLYEDNHVMVVNKKASDIVQGDKTGDVTLPDTIKSYLKEKYQKPGNVFCGVVHRLDRPTSGAVVFAKTSKALERLNAQFREKETNKVYWAIVENKPVANEGRLEHYLKKNEKQNKSYASLKPVDGSKQAILSYKLMAAKIINKYNELKEEQI
jgi:23S rRNA pseudouridine1911/1915/1917 synthase